MKRMMTLTTLSVVAMITTTPVLSQDWISYEAMEEGIAIQRRAEQKIQELMQKAKTDGDHIVLSEAIELLFFNLELAEDNTSSLHALVEKFEISQGLLVKALEHTVRENLSIMEKDVLATYPSGATGSFQILGTFKDYDMLPLVKEYLNSNRDFLRGSGMVYYIRIMGEVESIPFLRETFAKDTSMHRSGIYQQLEKAVKKLQSENKNDDAEKILSFLMEMSQKEDAPFSVSALDMVLCNLISDYANSVQRQRVIQRALDSAPPWHHNMDFAKFKAELDTLPADKRTDLSQRFTLTPQGVTLEDGLKPITANVTKQPIQEAEPPPPQQSERLSSNKTLLWFVVIVLLVIIGGVAMWRKVMRK